MPRLNEQLKKYGRTLWLTGFLLLTLICMGLLVQLWLGAREESREAFESGRRLLIAIDSGEVRGKILTLDAPPAPASVEAPPAETPSADMPPAAETPPVLETPETAPPAEGAVPAEESAPQSSATPPPAATPMPDVNPSLIERTENGDLPVIGSDGGKPWRYYSKPFERKRNQPMVAVVVSGLGLNREVTEDALNLHEYVTVSFSPYARDISSWRAATRATGHEMLIDLPLQPANYPLSDPGPYGLILEKGDVEAVRRMQWMMTRFPTSIGFLTPQNEAFTSNDEAMKMLLQSLANRGLMLVMGREPPRKETKDLLDASHTAHAVAGIWLDEEPSGVAIQARLTQLEEQAKKNGYAIGFAQSYPLTLSQLAAWSGSLAGKGIVLVPVSAIVKLRFS